MAGKAPRDIEAKDSRNRGYLYLSTIVNGDEYHEGFFCDKEEIPKYAGMMLFKALRMEVCMREAKYEDITFTDDYFLRNLDIRETDEPVIEWHQNLTTK